MHLTGQHRAPIVVDAIPTTPIIDPIPTTPRRKGKREEGPAWDGREDGGRARARVGEGSGGRTEDGGRSSREGKGAGGNGKGREGKKGKGKGRRAEGSRAGRIYYNSLQVCVCSCVTEAHSISLSSSQLEGTNGRTSARLRFSLPINIISSQHGSVSERSDHVK